MNQILDFYQGPAIKCCGNCDALVLGRLMQNMRQLHLSPEPSWPYSGLSFRKLAQDLKKIDFLTYCEATHEWRASHFNSHDLAKCKSTHMSAIKNAVRMLEVGITGLDL